jgi:ABC-2 type transport system permease protein
VSDVALPPARLRVTQARVVLSEWTKLRSLRSTLWSLGVATVLTIGFPCLAAAIVSSNWGGMNPGEQANHHPVEMALTGVNVSQLAIGVLGVLLISGEYSTGMIRATIGAVPRRLPVLWAKVAVFAAVTFGLMLPAVLAAFFASQALVSEHEPLRISFTAPGVARSVVGGALYLTVIGVFALGLGAIIRNTAGGIAAFAGVMFVLPPLTLVLPASWNDAISPYLPLSAGYAIFTLSPGSDSLSPWAGLAVLCGYAAAAIAVAAVLLVRRDT